jgi:hypothetical protein
VQTRTDITDGRHSDADGPALKRLSRPDFAPPSTQIANLSNPM